MLDITMEFLKAGADVNAEEVDMLNDIVDSVLPLYEDIHEDEEQQRVDERIKDILSAIGEREDGSNMMASSLTNRLKRTLSIGTEDTGGQTKRRMIADCDNE